MNKQAVFITLLALSLLSGCSYDTSNEYFDCGAGRNLGQEFCQCTAPDNMGGLNSINQRDETLTDYNHCAELIPQEIGSQYALSCVSYICTFKACNANEIQSKNKLKCIDITTTENCGSEGNACGENDFCTQDQTGSWKCAKVSKCDGNTVLSNDASRCVDITTTENCGREGNTCLEKQQCTQSNQVWTCAYVCDETTRPAPDCTCHESEWLCNTPPKITLAAVDLQTTEQGLQLKEGQNGAFVLSVNRAPDNELTIDLKVEADSSPTTSGSISIFPTSVTVTPSDWATPKEFTLLSQRDFRKLGDQPLLITATSRAQDGEVYAGVFTQLPIQYLEADTCGLVLENDPDLHTSEDGDAVTLNASLSCIPSAEVKYTVTSSNLSEGKITTGNTLVFTDANWNTPQAITITGENDDTCDGSQSYTVSITPDPENSQDFQESKDLEINNLDNDTPDLVITNTEISEGDSVSLSVRLLTIPKNDVTLTLASTSSDNGLLIEESTCTVTPSGESTVCTFNVSATDNVFSDHDRAVELKVTLASEDTDYNNMERTFNVTIKDDDIPSLVFTDYETTGTTPYSSPQRISEVTGGDFVNTASYRFHLKSQPKQNVTVSLAPESSVPTETLSFSSAVTFTPDTWNVDQKITVTAHNDGLVPDTNPQLYPLTFTTESDDTDYADVSEAAMISVADANAYDFYIQEPYTRILVAGESSEICISLKAKPQATVTASAVAYRVPVTITNPTLKIQPNEFNQKHCFTYRAGTPGSDETSYIKITLNSDDSNFDGLSVNSQFISVIPKQNTLVIEALSTQDLDCRPESRVTRDYTVRLGELPDTTVLVNIKVTPSGNFTVSPSSLQFTNTNGTTPQKVNLSCSEDSHASKNYLHGSIEFKSETLSETKTFNYYPGGKYFSYDTRYTYIPTKTLLPGKYLFELWGAQGGGIFGGTGGNLTSTVIVNEPVPITVYVGYQGSSSANTLTGSAGGDGGRKGGAGSGRHTVSSSSRTLYGYGGGGSTEIQTGSMSCRSFVAGSGGGSANGTTYANGGAGGCENPSDDQCKGRFYSGDPATSGATINTGEGEDANYDYSRIYAIGGGGAGFYGGSSDGYGDHGGNGGTSKAYILDNTCGNISIIRTTITPGVRSGDGAVKITALPE